VQSKERLTLNTKEITAKVMIWAIGVLLSKKEEAFSSRGVVFPLDSAF
jgi:hypothetical protein